MADAGRMIFLGFGKYARADKIYAVEPIVGKDRGGGHRTRVWIEGVPDPIIAGRTEEIYLVTKGAGSLEVDGETRRIRPGDAVLIPPGAWHTLENDGTSELLILCMCAPPYSDEDTFFE